MEIVAGLSLKGLKPPIWDTDSPYYLSNLESGDGLLRRFSLYVSSS